MNVLPIDLNTLDQISTLLWAHSGNTELAEKVAGVRLASDLWKKLSTETDTDALRNATIMDIANYVKEHPKASKEELAEQIGKRITEFAQRLEQI